MPRDDTPDGRLSVPTDGTAGTPTADGASEHDLREGYTPLHERMNDDGRSQAEDPFTLFDRVRGGFLDRPTGYER